MTWFEKYENDYRLYCHLGERRYLFADENLFPGKGFSAFIYYVDLDSAQSNERLADISLLARMNEGATDVDKAYLLADEREECDYQTECFADEDSMWDFVREHVAEDGMWNGEKKHVEDAASFF